MTFTECLGLIAPYYNLVLVALVILLFIKLLSLKEKGIYLRPWYYLFTAIFVYVIEEVITVMESMGIIDVNNLIFPVLEMIMITLFIYMFLLQTEYVKTLK